MLGRKVIELARLVGLGQSDIAHALHVDRQYVFYWAHGQREVSATYRKQLLDLVFHTARDHVLVIRQTPLAELRTLYGPHFTKSRFCKRVLGLIVACRTENLRARGLDQGLTAEVLVRELADIQQRTAANPADPALADALEVAAKRLHDLAMVESACARLAPLEKELREGGQNSTVLSG